jgi:hypothetical protein
MPANRAKKLKAVVQRTLGDAGSLVVGVLAEGEMSLINCLPAISVGFIHLFQTLDL